MRRAQPPAIQHPRPTCPFLIVFSLENRANAVFFNQPLIVLLSLTNMIRERGTCMKTLLSGLLLLALVLKGDVMANELATFAGGCFWCMEPPFQQLEGVLDVQSGYTGGHVDNPDYGDVCSGETGHYEAVEISYDPERISYERLLEVFWQNIDPTDSIGQFADKGSQYLSAVFYHDDAQRQAAEASRQALDKSGTFDKPVVTRILPASRFWPAEDYHQDFYMKEPDHYNRYKTGSGRAGFLKRIWSKD